MTYPAILVPGDSKYIQKLERTRDMLCELVFHLLNTYEDSTWTRETQELMEKANDYLDEPPIVWDIEKDIDQY